MGEVCLTCGDVGFFRQLVRCIKCKGSPVHRYCMETIPKSKHDRVRYLCEDCKVQDRNSCNQPFNTQHKPKNEGKNLGANTKKIPKQLDHESEIKSSFSATAKPRKDDQNDDGRSKTHKSHALAEPVIPLIWMGSFRLSRNGLLSEKAIDGFSAYLSTKACKRVYDEVVQLQPVLNLEILPMSSVWPKSFEESKPTDDNIAIYIFPSLMKYEGVYDYLVFDMVRDNLGMKGSVGNAELLIFTSIYLPSSCWRFQGKLYLWGVFRGKQSPDLHE